MSTDDILQCVVVSITGLGDNIRNAAPKMSRKTLVLKSHLHETIFTTLEKQINYILQGLKQKINCRDKNKKVLNCKDENYI